MWRFASATGFGRTVTAKVRLRGGGAPSGTVTRILGLPVWAATGVTVTVRLAPVPPKTMPAVFNSVALSDAAATVRLVAAVSRSPIVNGTAAVEFPTTTVWAGIAV